MQHLLILAFVCSLILSHSSAMADQQYGVERKVIEIDGYKGFILLPTTPAADGSHPWIWYAPTFIGAYPNAANGWVLQQLLDRGYAVCGVEVGESMGNPAGRKAFSTFYDYFVKQYKLDVKVNLLAQSRGGLMLYNWAAENPQKVRTITGIYPVCDLMSYPGLVAAAKAYGMTPELMTQKLKEHNPIDRLKPIAEAKVPILHIHGDSDAIVPLARNSQVVFDRYTAMGGPMKLLVIPSKGHAEIPEFFQDPRLVQFILEANLEKIKL